MKFIQSALSSLIFLSLTPFCVNATPNVVVSITPFYALVAAVMQDVGTPKLLLQPGVSPHEYTLKPSDILLLQNATLIFWGGPQLETFLVKPLSNVKALTAAQHKPKLLEIPYIVEFDDTPNLLLLPLRQSADWDLDEHDDHTHLHTLDDPAKSNVDMHFWLNPHNAIVLTDMIVKHLTIIDPIHATNYKENGFALKKRLKKLDAEIATELKMVKTIPYIVFHDAYQYFEKRYDLKGVGSITINPEIPPSAKRLTTIRNTIKKSKARCVFREPQFEPKIVNNIVADLGIQSGELDPLGQTAQNNAEGYFSLLENLSRALKQCLNP